MIKGHIIKSDGQDIVVKVWDTDDLDTGMRAITLPLDVMPDTADSNGVFDLADDVVGSGMPYGLSASDIAKWLPAQRIITKLNARGIWTQEDMQEHKDTVSRIFASAVLEVL